MNAISYCETSFCIVSRWGSSQPHRQGGGSSDGFPESEKKSERGAERFPRRVSKQEDNG